MNRTVLATSMIVLFAGSLRGDAAEATLRPDTERAWGSYIATIESRMAAELSAARGFLVMNATPDGAADRAATLAGKVPIAEVPVVDPNGKPFDVPSGTITHWRGAVFVPGVTLEQLLERAQHPSEHGPFPPDVLALRVLERRPDGIRLFIKMTRKKIVTVTYNTEHDVIYRRHGPTRASSRSIATKIAELERVAGGERELTPADDHGFLWRLNSYWRYEEVPGGVIAEMESLSLSRGIPIGLGPIVRPLANSVARESMTRTLIAFRDEQLRSDHTGTLAAPYRAR